MGLHIKSTTKFKFLIGASAIAVSGVAALFSVTGVSSLFKGSWLTIVLMMGILEFAKIIVASYIARFWTDISRTLRTYFVIAVVTLMVITSAGIFGYLSEAYQGTKGNYDITEQESGALTAKKINYEEQIQRYKDRVTTLNSFRASQEVRLDSLYSRGMTTSAKRVEQGIQRNDTEVQSLNDKISALTDSVGNIGTQIITKQSVNIKGELGPLKFIAVAFNTDMDTIVKYLILMLIVVFDPLAVLLFVSLSIMIRKESQLENGNVQSPEDELKNIVLNITEDSKAKKTDEISEVIIPRMYVQDPSIKFQTSSGSDAYTAIPGSMPVFEPSMLVVNLTGSIEEPIFLPEVPVEAVEIVPEIKNEVTASDSNEHTFYHGAPKIEEIPPPVPPVPSVPLHPEWRTANWKSR